MGIGRATKLRSQALGVSHDTLARCILQPTCAAALWLVKSDQTYLQKTLKMHLQFRQLNSKRAMEEA